MYSMETRMNTAFTVVRHFCHTLGILGLPLYSRSTSGFQEVAPCIFSIHAGSPLFTTVTLCPWLYQRLSIVHAMVYTAVNHGNLLPIGT